MRKFMLPLVAGAAIGLGASLASAADLPRKAPAYQPPPPPPLTWTGCYIGANIGGAWGRFELDGPFGGESSRNGQGGFAGGGQIGCDYQFAGSGFVIGFRNMFDGTTNHKDRDFLIHNAVGTTVATGSASFHNRWFDALTGRIGFSGPQALWLAYFQGGGVWSRVTADLTVYNLGGNAIGSGEWGKTKTGWTVGGGFEYRFAPQWSVFVEGNYYDFGTRETTLFTPVNTVCVNGCAFSGKTTAVTGLVGVNYRFWTQ
jgi:outer membrane immunogenic protein